MVVVAVTGAFVSAAALCNTTPCLLLRSLERDVNLLQRREGTAGPGKEGQHDWWAVQVLCSISLISKQ